MEFALITDQHFCVRNSSQYFIDLYRKFYTTVFFPELKRRGIKLIVCLGDTWEDRKMLNVYGINAAKEMYFDIARDHGIKIISILGNHDVYYRNTNSVHSMQFIEDSYDNVSIIYDTAVLDLDGFKLALCSWINKENYAERIEFLNTVEADALGGHFEINGFEMTRGNVCENGMSQETFKRFNEVWSGHFHFKSEIGAIKMLGNIAETNKGDIGAKRGFHIFNTDTRNLEFIENPYKVYVRHRYDPECDIVNFDYEQYKDQYVFVDFSSYLRIDTVKFNLFLDNLNKHAWGVEPVENEVIKPETNETVQIEYKSNMDMINNYIESTFTEEKDVSVLKNMMAELYSEALNLSEDD